MTHLPALEVLIERCEAAQGPDRELDARLFCELIEDRIWREEVYTIYAQSRAALRDVYRIGTIDPGEHSRNFSVTSSFEDARIPQYTASIDAALALAERLIPGCEVGIDPRFFIEDVEPNHVKFDAILCIPHWDRWNPVDGTWIERHEARHRNRVLAVLLATLRALRSLTKLEG
jgi:hypothetical protein